MDQLPNNQLSQDDEEKEESPKLDNKDQEKNEPGVSTPKPQSDTDKKKDDPDKRTNYTMPTLSVVLRMVVLGLFMVAVVLTFFVLIFTPVLVYSTQQKSQPDEWVTLIQSTNFRLQTFNSNKTNNTPTDILPNPYLAKFLQEEKDSEMYDQFHQEILLIPWEDLAENSSKMIIHRMIDVFYNSEDKDKGLVPLCFVDFVWNLVQIDYGQRYVKLVSHTKPKPFIIPSPPELEPWYPNLVIAKEPKHRPRCFDKEMECLINKFETSQSNFHPYMPLILLNDHKGDNVIQSPLFVYVSQISGCTLEAPTQDEVGEQRNKEEFIHPKDYRNKLRTFLKIGEDRKKSSSTYMSQSELQELIRVIKTTKCTIQGQVIDGGAIQKSISFTLSGQHLMKLSQCIVSPNHFRKAQDLLK